MMQVLYPRCNREKHPIHYAPLDSVQGKYISHKCKYKHKMKHKHKYKYISHKSKVNSKGPIVKPLINCSERYNTFWCKKTNIWVLFKGCKFYTPGTTKEII